MAYGNAILAGLLGGLGGAGTAIGGAFAQQQKDEMEREKLAQERDLRQQVIDAQASQFATTQKGLSTPAETLFGYIGMPLPPGMDPKQPIPNTIADNVIKQAADRQTVQQAQAVRGEQANVLERLGAGSPGSPGTPAVEPPDEGAMYSAGTPAIPATAATAANPRYQALAGLLRQGPLSEYLVKALDSEAEKTQLIGRDTRGYLKGSNYVPLPGSEPPPPPPLDPRNQRSTSYGPSGTTYSDKPIEATNMRDALAQSAEFGGLQRFEDALPDVKQRILQREQQLMIQRGAAGAQGRQDIEMNAPIGKEADNFTDPKTLEPARPGMPKSYVYNNYLSVPVKAVQAYKTLGQTLAEAEDVVRRRDDLFPPSSKGYAENMFKVGGAMAQYWATKNTDPDVRVLQGLQATIPLQVRTFGDVGNIAVAEREIAMSASGLGGPATKEATLANLNLIRRLVNESGSGASLPPLESLPRRKVGNAGTPESAGAGPSLGEPGYTGRVIQPDMPAAPPKPGNVWIKAPDGQWGQWNARKPIPQGYMR